MIRTLATPYCMLLGPLHFILLQFVKRLAKTILVLG